MKLLITAGPTQEPIDIVRFISNNSTGFFGYKLASIAANKGHKVVLVSGPTNLKSPDSVETIQIRTAGQMYEITKKEFYNCDALVMSAAVGDFKVKNPCITNKIKKEDEIPIIELERTPDILERLNRIKEKQIMVGFSLEVTDIENRALAKLNKKKLDIVIGNKITSSATPFGEKNLDFVMIDKTGKIKKFSNISKSNLAEEILNKLETLV